MSEIAQAGYYLIVTDEMTQLNTGLILPSVAFVSNTDGLSNWHTLDGGIVTGQICVLFKVCEDYIG